MRCLNRKDLFCWQCSEEPPHVIPPVDWCPVCKGIVNRKAAESRNTLKSMLSNKEKYSDSEIAFAEKMLWLVYSNTQNTTTLVDAYNTLYAKHEDLVERTKELYTQFPKTAFAVS